MLFRSRDDREREKRFREWLKELGEREWDHFSPALSHVHFCLNIEKRAAAQRAEADFFALLKEKGKIGSDSVWKEVSRPKFLWSLCLLSALGETRARQRPSLRRCRIIFST